MSKGRLGLRHGLWVSAICVLNLVFGIFQESEAAELRGYAQSRYYQYQSVSGINHTWLQQLRPEFLGKRSENIAWTFTPRLQNLSGRGAAADPHNIANWLTVERCYAQIYWDLVDVTVGRQALSFGVAQLWNPTDIFNVINFADYHGEDPGVNAVSAFLPLGPGKSLKAVAATDDGLRAIRAALQYWITAGQTDIKPIYAYDGLNRYHRFGLNLKGDLELGWWIEAVGCLGMSGNTSFAQGVVGADYSWPIFLSLYTSLQFYYDGSGVDSVSQYNRLSQFAGARSTLAQRYTSAQIQAVFSDSLSATAQNIFNVLDGSGVNTIGVTWYLHPHWQLDAGSSLSFGGVGSEFSPSASDDPANAYAEQSLFVWLRHYL